MSSRRIPRSNGFLIIFIRTRQLRIGRRHPLAAASLQECEFWYGLSQFAINMARFDKRKPDAGTASSTNLITLQLHGSRSTTVTIEVDMLPGCSFVECGQTVNLPGC